MLRTARLESFTNSGGPKHHEKRGINRFLESKKAKSTTGELLMYQDNFDENSVLTMWSEKHLLSKKKMNNFSPRQEIETKHLSTKAAILRILRHKKDRKLSLSDSKYRNGQYVEIREKTNKKKTKSETVVSSHLKNIGRLTFHKLGSSVKENREGILVGIEMPAVLGEPRHTRDKVEVTSQNMNEFLVWEHRDVLQEEYKLKNSASNLQGEERIGEISSSRMSQKSTKSCKMLKSFSKVSLVANEENTGLSLLSQYKNLGKGTQLNVAGDDFVFKEGFLNEVGANHTIGHAEKNQCNSSSIRKKVSPHNIMNVSANISHSCHEKNRFESNRNRYSVISKHSSERPLTGSQSSWSFLPCNNLMEIPSEKVDSSLVSSDTPRIKNHHPGRNEHERNLVVHVQNDKTLNSALLSSEQKYSKIQVPMAQQTFSFIDIIVDDKFLAQENGKSNKLQNTSLQSMRTFASPKLSRCKHEASAQFNKLQRTNVVDNHINLYSGEENTPFTPLRSTVKSPSVLIPTSNADSPANFGDQKSPLPILFDDSFAMMAPESQEDVNPEFIKVVASIVIQTFFRRHLAYRLTWKRYNAALIIQHFARIYMGLKRKTVEVIRDSTFRLYDLAAIEIQAAFRGWWVRDCANLDNYCATLIQQNARSYLTRLNFKFNLYQIIIIQSVVRRYLVKAQHRLHNQGAILIQAEWRRFKAQLNFMHNLADILLVQSICRRHLAELRATQTSQTRCLVIPTTNNSNNKIRDFNVSTKNTVASVKELDTEELILKWKGRRHKLSENSHPRRRRLSPLSHNFN